MKMKASFLAAAVAGLFGAAGAQASVTVYTSQASFLAALQQSGVDTFNDLTADSLLTSPLDRSAGTFGYTAAITSGFWPGTVNGTDIYLSTNSRLESVDFSGFSADVNAIGGNFFRTNVNSLPTTTPGTLNFSITDASGSYSQSLANPTQTSFLGFISDSSILSMSLWVGTLGTGTAGVWPTIDNLTLGTVGAVPEPGSYALLASGLVLVGWLARRRGADRAAD